MQTFHVAALPHTPDPSDRLLATVLAQVETGGNLVWREIYGSDDFDQPAGHWARELGAQQSSDRVLLIALAGPAPQDAQVWHGLPLAGTGTAPGQQVLGGSFASHERQANSHLLGDLEIWVDSTHRRRGIGSSLVAAAITAGQPWQVSELHAWNCHRQAAPDQPGISAPPLGVRVALDASVRFAQSQGFGLAQAEEASAWDLQRHPPAAPHLPSDYDLVDWEGVCPAAWLDDLAGLHTALKRDIPKGELSLDDEVWDAARVIAHDEDLLVSQQLRVAAVRHRASDHLVGYSQLTRDPLVPGAAWQGTTVILPEHRGRGLARAIKLANARTVLAHWRPTTRIRTWNAAENQPMLAINRSLGFELSWITAAWVRKLG